MFDRSPLGFRDLGLDGMVPDRSTFPLNRKSWFLEGNLLRRVLEKVTERCLDEGLIGGDSFAVDASLIWTNANKQRSAPADE